MPTHKWTKYSRSVEDELRDHKVLTRAVFNRDINKESEPIARNSWKKFMSNLRASSELMIVESKMKCPVSQRISSAFSIEGVDADSAMSTNILSWEKEPIRCLQQMLKNVEGFSDEPITLTALAELTGVEGYPTDAPGRREASAILVDGDRGFGFNYQIKHGLSWVLADNAEYEVWRNA